MKGGAGLRVLSWRLTLFTVKGAAFTASLTVRTSCSLRSSCFFSAPWKAAVKAPRLGEMRLRSASRDQYSWG